MRRGTVACAALGALLAGFAAPAHGEDGAPLPPARPPSLSGGAPEQAVGASIQGKPGDSDAEAPDGRRKFLALLKRETGKTGLPLDVADAVVAVESGYDPTVIGGVGEIGLMQVRPETAAMLGFRGDTAELARPEVNIHYGVAYLTEAWRRANGDLCRALMKYRAGHGEEEMSALSVSYCGRARAHLAAMGSPYAAAASVPMVFDAMALPARRALRTSRRGLPPLRTAATRRAFWAAHEARIAAINRRIEAKWRRMASR